jgi:hypothetical protein
MLVNAYWRTFKELFVNKSLGFRSQKKQKPPKHQAANFPETSLRNIFIPRIEQFIRSRHRGVSSPVAGLGIYSSRS